MFGWRRVGTTTRPTMKMYGAVLTRGEVARFDWNWGRHSWFFYFYGRRNRLTGPESNSAVLRHFHSAGQPGRALPSGGAKFREGFAKAAKKPAVKLPRYADRCPGCDDPEC